MSFISDTARYMATLNRNFVLNVALAALQGFADSLAGGTVGVAFIYSAFGDSNAKVGFAEALQGIASLATALPAGWAADRWPRSRVIAVGGVTSLAAAPLFGYAVLEATTAARDGESSHRAYVMLCIAFTLFGFGSGIGNGPAQALMADSIPTGQRSDYYNWLFQAYVIPGILGPAIGIVWFLTRGDKWSLSALRDLMLVGICLQFPMAACMFSFRDDRTLGAASESVTKQKRDSSSSNNRNSSSSSSSSSTATGSRNNGRAQQETAGAAVGVVMRSSEVSTAGMSLTSTPAAVPDLESSSLWSPLLDGGEGGSDGSVYPSLVATLDSPDSEDCGTNDNDDGRREGSSGDSNDGNSDEGEESLHALSEWVPCIVFSSGLIVALASGMTIKYFPLYFKNTLNMTPAAVQGIYVAVPFAMALASQLATWLGKAIGRVQAVITLRFTGLACFSGMVVLDSLGLDKTSPEVKWAIAVLYVCRTALMNCSYPLEESILMDYAPKATRARWKSLESVSIAGWCGSAFVGGILADHYGYTFTFIITIGLQAAGTLVYASLLGVVVVEVNEPSNSDDGDEKKKKTTGLDGYQKPPIEDPEEVTAVA